MIDDALNAWNNNYDSNIIYYGRFKDYIYIDNDSDSDTEDDEYTYDNYIESISNF